jgi:hypothetical protein
MKDNTVGLMEHTHERHHCWTDGAHTCRSCPTLLAGRFTQLCPGRAAWVLRTLLASLGGEPRAATEPPSPVLSKCVKLLQLLSKQVCAGVTECAD